MTGKALHPPGPGTFQPCPTSSPALLPLLLTACLADPAGSGAGPVVDHRADDHPKLGRTNVTLLAAWALAPDRAWAAGQAG